MNFKEVFFSKGEIIVKKGHTSDNIFFIRKGQVGLTKKKNTYFAHLKEGDIFGATDFILEKPIRYSVVALTDVEINLVDPRIFSRIYDHEQADVIKPILQSLAEEIRMYEHKLEDCKCNFQHSNNGDNNQASIIFKAVTPAAKILLNNQEEIEIEEFPFRVGRFSKRKSDRLFHKNSLNLLDTPPYSISRSHFSINKQKGSYFFIDRGSKLGTVVNGKKIGGRQRNTKILLEEGSNQINLGDKRADLVFAIEINL